jgi:hypothetical protein
VDSSSAFAPSDLERWRRRENLLPALVLIALAAAGWAYVAYQAASMGSMESAMDGMAMGSIGGAALSLSGWTAMMVAMMVPATLPLILLYHTIARNCLSLVRARVGMVTLLVGYIAVWAAAGLPVYAYALFAEGAGSLATVFFAPRGRGHVPVHAAKAHVPRPLQQPIVFSDAELAAGSYRRSAAGYAPRRRLPGLLRGADGRAGGAWDDELSVDAHCRSHHLRTEDYP